MKIFLLFEDCFMVDEGNLEEFQEKLASKERRNIVSLPPIPNVFRERRLCEEKL